LDRHLLQTLLKITAGAYAPKMSRKVSREEQQRVQDWMASYSSSLYKELVSMYKTKLPSAVFHNNEDKTRQLWSEAHRNLEQLKAELPNLSW
jgi:thiaminase